MDLDLTKIKKVYLAGIGGIGLSSLAYYFLHLNKEVEGSDLTLTEITDRLQDKGVYINRSQAAKNINSTVDLLIYSSALPDDHPELVQAKKLNIPSLSYFQFLGKLSRQYRTIAVAGTNGKTTTTAMLGLILEKAGLDPTVIVGSLVPQWNSNFRFGQSNILVVEACEWRAHMLELSPEILILTNISEDHLDYYRNLDDIQKHFQLFSDKLPDNGLLVKNFDDQNSQSIKSPAKTLTFGSAEASDYYFSDVKINPGEQNFVVHHQTEKLGDFDLKVPGRYNIYNSLAVIATADYLQINKHQIWNCLREFAGTWRRFEKIGNYKSNLVISDYAHHPEAIRQLLSATKDFYPDKNLLVIFQPHHHNRTKTLLADFARSFRLADNVIITEIYEVKGREDKVTASVTSRDLISRMDQTNVHYAAGLKDVKKILRQLAPVNSVLLFVGAGDIDGLAREIVK